MSANPSKRVVAKAVHYGLLNSGFCNSRKDSKFPHVVMSKTVRRKLTFVKVNAFDNIEEITLVDGRTVYAPKWQEFWGKAGRLATEYLEKNHHTIEIKSVVHNNKFATAEA